MSNGNKTGMSADLITSAEIEYVKAHAVTIDPIKIMQEGKQFPPILEPYYLKSGYSISYSLDIAPNFPVVHHISIRHENHKTDPADAEHIARTILGAKYIVFGAMNVKWVLHFYSCSDLERLDNFLRRLKRNIPTYQI